MPLRLAIRRSQIWKDGLENWTNLAMGAHSRVVSEATRECFELATTTQPSVKQTGGSYMEGALAIDTQELYNSQRVTVNGETVSEGPGSPDGVPDSITQRTNVSLVFDAPYARFHEYGTSKFGGRFFVTNARQQWLRLVDAAAGRHRL